MKQWFQLSWNEVEDTDNRDLRETSVLLKDGTLIDVDLDFCIDLLENAWANSGRPTRLMRLILWLLVRMFKS